MVGLFAQRGKESRGRAQIVKGSKGDSFFFPISLRWCVRISFSRCTFGAEDNMKFHEVIEAIFQVSTPDSLFVRPPPPPYQHTLTVAASVY